MNADGSSQIKLTNSEFGADPAPAWSPDGTRIAFASGPRSNSEISEMNTDGSNRTRLTNNQARDSNPDWSPDSARIVFTSLRNGLLNPEIYVMNADGSSQINLTNNPGWDETPAWSPDGTRIAFARGLVGNNEIYVMNADGSNQTRLTNSGFDSNPAWSPDGTRIAFASSRDGNAEIYVMNADGSNQTRLTNETGSDPAWSPDGTRIAFTRGGEIYVINTDGSNQTRLTNTPVGSSDQPDWSPDGTRIVFTTSQTPNPEINSGIYVMNPDGSNQTRLTNSEFEFDPAWSPDGTRIAFATFFRRADGAFLPDEIYVMNADGSNQTRLTNSTFLLGSSDPAWSPDGTRIAFGTFQDWNDQFARDEIYVMNADGSSQINLTNNSGLDGEPTWSPDGARIAFTRQQVDDLEIFVMNADGSNQTRLTSGPHSFDPAWSPDGTRIVFTSNQDSNAAPSQIYVMNTDGSNQTRLTNNPGAHSSGPAWQAIPATPANPIDNAAFFVRQHYLDFLNREPDQGGWDYWTSQIISCPPGDQPCINARRIRVSDAFFFEPEFQQTGSYVLRLYRAAYGNNQPLHNPDPGDPSAPFYPGPNFHLKFPSYAVFNQDRARVDASSPTALTQSQLALANAFVQRAEFLAKYSAGLNGPDFVNAVLATLSSASGVDLTSRSGTLNSLYNQGGRGLVMFHLANDYWNGCGPGLPAPCVPPNVGPAVDNRPFVDAEYNLVFVTTEYFGYLRRDGDANGLNFWLVEQVNRFPLRDIGIQHAMVCSFITSAEYQLRFGSLVTHTNAECNPSCAGCWDY